MPPLSIHSFRPVFRIIAALVIAAVFSTADGAEPHPRDGVQRIRLLPPGREPEALLSRPIGTTIEYHD